MKQEKREKNKREQEYHKIHTEKESAYEEKSIE